MDMNTVQSFFLWCTVINAGLLLLSFQIFAFAGDWVFRMHSRWIPISRESFNTSIYCLLGIYKILIILLNLVPYVALVIIG